MVDITKTLEKVPVTTYTTEERYILELNKDEAETLFYLCQKIGGSPDNSRRKYFDQIAAGFEKLGFEFDYDKSDYISIGHITYREGR